MSEILSATVTMLTMLAMILAGGILMLLVFAALGFHFFKSSKDFPKSWYELREELLLQGLGIRGLVEDFLFRANNRVELYKQPGRVAVITGGNRGIGIRVVEKLLECEMTVVMGVRDPEAGRKNVSEVVNLETCKGKLICEKLDTGNLKSVREFAEKVQLSFDKIDILLNNAGIMFAPFQLTADNFESHFAVNYLGHFLLTHLLMPQIKKAGTSTQNARIINVSSLVNVIGKINYNDINRTKKYYPAAAYNQSKLAQLLFTRHLNRMMVNDNTLIQVHAVHPGVVDTDLFVHTSTTAVPGIKKLFFKSPEEGSRTVVYAAISPKIEGCGGTYLSNCIKSQMHPHGKNLEKCEKFFNFSCELLGIKEFGNGKC